jgi:hypothetical protein
VESTALATVRVESDAERRGVAFSAAQPAAKATRRAATARPDVLLGKRRIVGS